MKLIIDIYHPADINFYKNAINKLSKKNVEVELIVRPRGKLVPILQKELPNLPLKIIGTYHNSTKVKILGYIKRELELINYLSRIDFDVTTAFGSQICRPSRILGKPSVAFYDDFEYKSNFYLCKYSSTRYVIPDYIPSFGRNIVKYKGLKELAYLHPKYFKPAKKILDDYNLKSNEYVFIREIANTSLNYRTASSRLHEIIPFLREMGFDVVVSLEDLSIKEKFKDCIILNEPVDDIYSLLNFASLTVSSGDTMARESCLVGTPTIYTGSRDMSVNKELIEKECMYKVDNIMDIIPTVKKIVDNDYKGKNRDIIDYNIKHEWDDVTEVIVKNIMDMM